MFEKFAQKIEELRVGMLFEESVEDNGTDDIAAQHYLAALASLEQAHRSMKLAHIHQVRAIALEQLGRGGAWRRT